MPREIVTLQVGQCGNQIGSRLWDLALCEHLTRDGGDYTDAMSTFFQEGPSAERGRAGGRVAISDYRARAVLVDMEEGVVNAVRRGPLGCLFDDSQYISASYGAGNNWGCGFGEYGPAYREPIIEAVRQQLEQCSSPQSFFMLNSLGGGTGSGLGSYVLGALEDEFPELYRFATVVFPSEDDDVITSPYNSILSLRELTERADCVLPIENQALMNIVQRVHAQGGPSRGRQDGRHTTPVTAQELVARGGALASRSSAGRGGDAVCPRSAVTETHRARMAARRAGRGGKRADAGSGAPASRGSGLSAARAGRSAEGGAGAAAGGGEGAAQRSGASAKAEAYDEMNNIAAHLLTNLTASVRFDGALNVDLNELTTNLVPFPRMHFLLSSLCPLYAPKDVRSLTGPRRVGQMFTDALSPEHHLLDVAPLNSTYLACAMMVRGDVEVSDLTANVERLRPRLRMAPWNEDGFKLGLCGTPPVGQPYSTLCLSNNCAIAQRFRALHGKFRKLYRHRAHVHHYTQYIEGSMLEEASVSAMELAAEYEGVHAAGGDPFAAGQAGPRVRVVA